MMTDETPSTDPKQQIPDLSGLADFQFGPAWARPGARQERPVSYPERRSGDRQEATADRGATTVKAASPGGTSC